MIAFAHGPANKGNNLAIADRRGTIVGSPFGLGAFANPHLSPDGHRLLVEREAPDAGPWGDVGVFDLDRGTETRLTFTNGLAVRSGWSPDGRRFACTVVPPGGHDHLLVGSADGLGGQDSIPLSAPFTYFSQWSANGPRLLLHTPRFRVYQLAPDGPDRSLRPFGDSTLRLGQPQLSPDGRFVAGVLRTPSAVELFVQSMTGTPGRWQVSSDKGGRGVWTRGGRELVYENDAGKLVAVPVDTRQGFRLGIPQPLFTLPVASPTPLFQTWAVDASGERFALVVPQGGARRGREIEVVSSFAALVGHR